MAASSSAIVPAAAAAPADPAAYDLTFELSGALDRHLVFPLLEFLSHKGIYDEKEIEGAKIELLQKTNMVDYAMDVYCQLHGAQEAPAAMVERRGEVIDKLKTLQGQAEAIVAFLSDENAVKQLRQDKNYNLEFLRQQFQIGPEDIEALYHYAKFQFECGNYSGAAEFLYHYRSLSTSNEQNLSALWGKLAAQILQLDFDAAMDDLLKLKEMVDASTFQPLLVQLQQRNWLMHWSLFVFFNHENGKNAIIDMFFQDRYLNTLQTVGQHLLRYLAVAVITNKRRRNVLKQLVQVIQQESYEYSDPITQFLECLFVRYDFEGAQAKLAECEQVIENDFFLTACKEEFVENARLFIFETYCRIHQTIDLSMLASKLHMDVGAAEKWIVELIRDARLNAKIDSRAHTVNMGQEYPGAYEQVLEKAKGLSVRTFMLANAVVGASRV